MREKPTLLNKTVVAQSRLFRIESLDLEFSNGEQRNYERLARSKPGGAVLIVPLLDDETVFDFLSFLPRLEDELVSQDVVLRNPDDTLQYNISIDEWGEYLFKKNATRRFLLDSNNLYVSLLLGDGVALEPRNGAPRVEPLLLEDTLGVVGRDVLVELAEEVALVLGAGEDRFGDHLPGEGRDFRLVLPVDLEARVEKSRDGAFHHGGGRGEGREQGQDEAHGRV